MKRIRKFAFISLAAAIVIGAVFSLRGLFTLKTSFSRADSYKTMDELIASSKLIVFAEATGRTESISVNERVTFRTTEVVITEYIKGNSQGTTVNILQTEGFDADVPLKRGQKYLLMLKPYTGGVEHVIGSYVISDSFEGLYLIADDEHVTAVAPPGYENDKETILQREQAAQKLIDNR